MTEQTRTQHYEAVAKKYGKEVADRIFKVEEVVGTGELVTRLWTVLCDEDLLLSVLQKVEDIVI